MPRARGHRRAHPPVHPGHQRPVCHRPRRVPYHGTARGICPLPPVICVVDLGYVADPGYSRAPDPPPGPDPPRKILVDGGRDGRGEAAGTGAGSGTSGDHALAGRAVTTAGLTHAKRNGLTRERNAIASIGYLFSTKTESSAQTILVIVLMSEYGGASHTGEAAPGRVQRIRCSPIH